VWIIVGLGNPGREYRLTRHNIGFMVVEEFARRARISWGEHRRVAEVGRGRLAGHEILVIKPIEFMNRSGQAVASLLKRMGGAMDSMVVVHDDMDLTFGKIKIREGGGSGGHRGVQSLVDELASEDFVRLKMGIGRPEMEEPPEEHVLSRFSAEQAERVPFFVASGADALECIVREGSGRAMNRFNIEKQWDRRDEKEEKKKQARKVEGLKEKPGNEGKEGTDA